MRTERRTVTPWWYILGGCLIGAAIGLLAAPLAGYELPKAAGEEEKPGLGSRLVAKIPMKVKLAGAVGAVEHAGREAFREMKQKARRRR